jgi:hypothetical protein
MGMLHTLPAPARDAILTSLDADDHARYGIDPPTVRMPVA